MVGTSPEAGPPQNQKAPELRTLRPEVLTAITGKVGAHDQCKHTRAFAQRKTEPDIHLSGQRDLPFHGGKLPWTPPDGATLPYAAGENGQSLRRSLAETADAGRQTGSSQRDDLPRPIGR
jgi:hypothetical protein